jgi:hypothetical protein
MSKTSCSLLNASVGAGNAVLNEEGCLAMIVYSEGEVSSLVGKKSLWGAYGAALMAV